MSIEIEDIECVKHGAIRCQLSAPSAEGLLQGVEIASALVIQDHGLSVEDHGRRAESFVLGRDGGKPHSPVMAPTRQHADLAAQFDVHGDSISVPLYLVTPFRPLGRLAVNSARQGSTLDGIGSKGSSG